jgi:endonuclease/exonuclease/phosphatase family metal-dependent hydrolase
MNYRICFWNLENLFAPENFPTREPWIARTIASDLAGWTDALFRRKISQLATIIAQLANGAGPDILGVCEVENRFVLDVLAEEISGRLAARNYGVVHADSTLDKRGIDTAFIVDQNVFTVEPNTIFSHFVIRRTGTRDILQATFHAHTGHELVALCNHWPSRSGGVEESAGFRETAGETLGYWHERIREERGDDIPVIALGDFNDDPFNNSLRYNANAWRERGDVERSRSAKFYNLAWRYLSQDCVDHRGDPRTIDGTLYYGNDGNVFDQILVNRSLLNGERGLTVLEESVGIDAISQMVDHRVNAGPIRFGLPKGNATQNVNTDGFSDHFPVSVTVVDSG